MAVQSVQTGCYFLNPVRIKLKKRSIIFYSNGIPKERSEVELFLNF